MFNLITHSMNEQSRLHWGQVSRIVLAAIGITGAISVAIVAPNALQVLKLFQKRNRRHHSSVYVQGILKRLKQKGLVKIFNRNGEPVACLTRLGKKELLQYIYQEKKTRQEKWDQKWRIIIFDIPERYRRSRDKIRREMMNFGFFRLQDSVWVYPHECEEAVSLLKAEYKIGKELLYITAETLEGDEKLQIHFKLAANR